MKKLDLTDAQFRTLLQLVYLGNFMANATRDETIQEYDDIEQYIYVNAEKFGCGEFVDVHDAVDGVYPTRNFEEMMNLLVEKYDNDFFYDELIHRLSERDLIAKYSEAEVLKMGIVERIEKEREFTKIYDREFSEKGIENLVLHKETSV